MQHGASVKRADVLVLSPDRRPKMLVRRPADAFKIIVALAGGSNGTSQFPPGDNIVPASHFNLLDAQASISDDLEAKPNPDAKPETADSSPVPTSKPPLTPDGLRVFANSMAAMTAEPVVAILDRWPDAEMPQQRTKPTPVEQPSPTSTRTFMMVAITFMALLAVLMTTFRRVRRARPGGGSLLLGYSDLTWRRPTFTAISWPRDLRV